MIKISPKKNFSSFEGSSCSGMFSPPLTRALLSTSENAFKICRFKIEISDAPMMTPGMFPVPPSITIASTMNEICTVKLSGLTKPCFAANTTPITPPKQALMTNEAIFIFTIGMPTARAAVSSSRMAVHARPSFEFSSLWQIRMTAAASSRTMKYI